MLRFRRGFAGSVKTCLLHVVVRVAVHVVLAVLVLAVMQVAVFLD